MRKGTQWSPDHPDAPTDEEALDEWRDELAHLEGGHIDRVPSWMTMEDCITYARAEIARLEGLIADC